MIRQLSILIGIAYLLFSSLPAYAGFSIIKGEWTDERFLPTVSVQEHYEKGLKCMEHQEWDEALSNFMIIALNFQETSFYNESLFFSGVAYFKLGELDLSNKQLSNYLMQKGSSRHFEEVFEYKFQIAEEYRNGARRHMFGYEHMPKWSTGKSEALRLYDEINVSLPNKNLAAQALFAKGLLLRDREEFRESIDALQILVRRFPKHPLAAESFLCISKIYVLQSEIEAQNPDILALAQINLRKFRKAFPGDDRLNEAESDLLVMQESFANSLYETGRFYEKKKKPHAAAIYYNDTIRRYPETISAQKSRERLVVLKEKGVDSAIVQNAAIKKQNPKNVPSKGSVR